MSVPSKTVCQYCGQAPSFTSAISPCPVSKKGHEFISVANMQHTIFDAPAPALTFSHDHTFTTPTKSDVVWTGRNGVICAVHRDNDHPRTCRACAYALLRGGRDEEWCNDPRNAGAHTQAITISVPDGFQLSPEPGVSTELQYRKLDEIDKLSASISKVITSVACDGKRKAEANDLAERLALLLRGAALYGSD